MVYDVLPTSLRWLALVTGCLIASIGLLLLWTDPVLPCFLILSAIVQPRSPKPGRLLMWVSTVLINIWMIPFFGGLARHLDIKEVPIPSALILVGVAALLFFDGALLLNAARNRRQKSAAVQDSRGALDWTVWVAALALSVWIGRTTMLAVRYDQMYHDISKPVTGFSLAAFVILFDVALIVQARKAA